MMRVLHVVSHLGTYGGERFVSALAAAQHRAGLDASVVTIYDAQETPAGVPVYSAGRRNAGRARGGGFLFFFRLMKFVRELRPDVVHTHLAHAKHWGRLAAAIAGTPTLVHTEHGNAFGEPPHKRILTRILNGRTAAIIAFSGLHARRIAQNEGFPLERIAVIPNGIEIDAAIPDRDSARAELGITAGQVMILSIGRLEAVKRHDLAIDALALVPRQDVRLFIAGDGGLEESLLAQARRAGVEGRVHLLGYRRDVRALLSAADVAVNSSESEAMPLALLEATCAGVPIACAPWPGASELLAGVGEIARDGSAPALAAALERAMQPESRRRAHEAMPAARARFSIDATAALHADLYRSLCRRSRNTRAVGRKSLAAPARRGLR